MSGFRFVQFANADDLERVWRQPGRIRAHARAGYTELKGGLKGGCIFHNYKLINKNNYFK